MYLRTTERKNKDGIAVPYLQIAENRWNSAKKRSEVDIVLNIGRADEHKEERLRNLAHSILKRCDHDYMDKKDITTLYSWAYGDQYVLEKLWHRLDIKQELRLHLRKAGFQTPLERAAFVMVANRCIAPYSKLYCYEQWMKEDIYFPDGKDIQLHHFYRAMDFLEAHKEEVEKAVFWKLADLLNLDVDLIFYDTTTVSFEIDEEDGKDEASPDNKSKERKDPKLRKRGRPNEGKGQVPQVVVGLAITRDGIPVRSWVFPGNTVDVTTVQQVKNDLKGWHLNRCIFVGDRGMVSEENLKILSSSGGRYILGMHLRRGEEVSEEVLSRPGKFAPLKDSSLFPRTKAEKEGGAEASTEEASLYVKEVWVPYKGAGERARRYVVCFNPKEEKRQKAHREKVLLHLEEDLSSLERCKEDHPKRACELLSSKRYGKYLSQGSKGRLHIDHKKVRREERLDGKFVVYSNDDTLTPSDLALGYKHLVRVEQCWRDLKSGIKMGPMYHRAPFRIKAHVTLCMLALLLQRVAENACNDTWRNIRDALKRIQVTEYESPNGRFFQTNAIQTEPAKVLKALNIPEPKPILAVK